MDLTIEQQCRLLAQQILKDDLESLAIEIGRRDQRIRALEEDLAAARKAGLVHDGRLMEMLGKPNVTADHCVILDREVTVYLPTVNGDVFAGQASCFLRMDRCYASRDAASEASKAEAAAIASRPVCPPNTVIRSGVVPPPPPPPNEDPETSPYRSKRGAW